MRRFALLACAACTAVAGVLRAETHTFFVRMDGAQEVPSTTTGASGIGYMVLDTSLHTLTFHLAHSGLVGTETAAHIHGFAAPGTNAGILYPLPAGSPKVGTVATAPGDESSILAGLTYVNVHTTAFPAGEIRGQVIATTRFLLRATLDGSQEVPPLATTGTGTGAWLLDTAAHTLRTVVSFQDLLGPETVAHIHGFAAPGAFAGPLYHLPLGSPVDHVEAIDPAWEASFLAGLGYVNIHSTVFLNGEIRGQMLLSAPPLATYLCVGDGSAAACPCGNSSSAGSDSGCAHSFGIGGSLRVDGFASLALDTLALTSSGLPSSTTVLFFQGTTAANGGSGVAFGDGLRCASGAVVRLGTRIASAGTATIPSNGSAVVHLAGGVTVPGSRTYQGWFRNSAVFCTASTFNLTNGAALVWEL